MYLNNKFIYLIQAALLLNHVQGFISSSSSLSPSLMSSTRSKLKHHPQTIVHAQKDGDKSSVTTTTTKKHGSKTNKNGKGSAYWKEIDQAKKINKELMSVNSAQEVLELFIAKGGAKGVAGNNVFNSVNFSTLVHRLARFALETDHGQRKNSNHQKGKIFSNVQNNRSVVLSDPRTAILLASLSEALVQPKTNSMLTFNNRELANLAWAIAKLKIVPPMDILPLVRPGEKTTLSDMEKDIIITATKVRTDVLHVAKERSNLSSAEERASVQNKWIPTLSQLSGKLLDIIAAHVLQILDDFNSQELANLLYAFSSAQRADTYLFDQLANTFVRRINSEKTMGRGGQNQQEPKPQEYSNSVWSFASSGIRSDGQIKLVQTVADKMDENNGALVQHFKPQELSNTAWGCATLLVKRGSEETTSNRVEDEAVVRIMRWVAKSLEERVEMFKPQEVSNSIWAWATVGFGATTSNIQFNTNNDYISIRSDEPNQDKELVKRTLDIVAENALLRLHRFRPQELNNLAWGFCRLGHSGPSLNALFRGIGQELLKRHFYFAPQDIGTTLWSFATVEYFDEEVYRAAASELTLRKSRSFKPQELSNTVWALATAGALPKYPNAFDITIVPNNKRPSLKIITEDPITECFAAATTELIRRPHQFKAQEIKDVLWSLSKAGIRHPAVFKSVAEYLVGSDTDIASGKKGRGMDAFSPQGLGNLAWSYAKQAQLSAAVNDSTIGTTGRLAIYETICLDVGESLIQRLFTEIANTCISDAYGLGRFKPQDLSNTCWAFATLGLIHGQYFDAVCNQVKERLSPEMARANPASAKFKAQEIANLVWAYATLNHSAPGMLDSFTPYIMHMCTKKSGIVTTKSIAKYMKRQEAANLAWSCAVLQQYPKDLIPLLYTALFGENIEGNPNELLKIYADNGIQKQAIMTMFYVQMAVQLEAPDLHLSLPLNFPTEWKESDSNQKVAGTIDDSTFDSSMLQLTTSRLQNNISGRLKQIQFDHVLEHTISTDELYSQLGIRLSNENQEFLSVDIANLDRKVGIEVDGPGHFVNVLDADTSTDPSAETVSSSEGSAIKLFSGKTGWQFKATTQQRVNGPTALKYRLMSHLGWSLAHIPYFEWRDLKGDPEKEEEY